MKYLDSYNEGFLQKKKLDKSWINNLIELIKVDATINPKSVLYQNISDEETKISITLRNDIVISLNIDLTRQFYDDDYGLNSRSPRRTDSEKNIFITAHVHDNINSYFTSTRTEFKLYNKNQEFSNSIISHIIRNIEVIDNKIANKSKAEDFMQRLTKEDIEDLFLELGDILGDCIVKNSDNCFLIKFKMDRKGLEIFSKKWYEINDLFVKSMTELNFIEKRLNSFNAKMLFSVEKGDLNIIIFSNDVPYGSLRNYRL